MIPGLLKMFLKKMKVLALALPAVCILTVVTSFDVNAAVTITKASWNANNNTLDVKGSDGSGVIVTVLNADTRTLVGGDVTNNGGKWSIRLRRPAEVPCRVIAETADFTSVIVDVSGIAPPDCVNGGEVNVPPVANDDFYNATTGVTLSVAAPGVLDNDTDDGLLGPLQATLVTDVENGTLVLDSDGSFTYTSNLGFAGNDTFTYSASDGEFADTATVTITVTAGGGGNTPPIANDDAYATDMNTPIHVAAPGVLGNDTDADGDALTAVFNTDVSHGSLTLFADGSFDYTPNTNFTGTDSFSYFAHDGTVQSDTAATVTITVNNTLTPPDIGLGNPQTDFKIMMNYELGMHCTGFEFAYCCVLPAYNSILAQVVKPDATGQGHPELLAGDPNAGLDALGRETVVRDRVQGGNGFKKYVLKYWHDAQPRNDGRGKAQTSTLISAAEGNSLLSWNTIFDSAALNADGSFVTGDYNGAQGVILGDGDLNDPSDNYQNAVWNHLYFYGNNGGPPLEGDNPNNSSLEADKIRLGVSGQLIMDVVYPTDCGPALHPLGPVTTDEFGNTVDNNCGGFSNGNVLTFSGDKGTVVYTQMKVLENLPIMLTSPDIWEALGLPLTPFEDSIDFFSDPGLLNEDSVRPFVAMKAQMYDYDSTKPDGAGSATLDSVGNPVIGFGTAPIDIPNCERCHSNPPDGSMIQNAENEGGGMLEVINSPNTLDPLAWANTQQEYEFWNAYYNIDKAAGDSDWYSRLKSAALSMLTGHDTQHGTSFTANYPGCGPDATPPSDCGATPQNTRLGHESVICQRCHADNVIAVVKSAECAVGNASCAQGTLITPITEAIHNNHRGVSMLDANGDPGVITFADSLGRDGGCQGCHPAHRSNGDMDGYPITLAGGNRYAASDNRGANGGCFVGRDVHSNPGKDTDGVETGEHLNAVGQYLADNVYSDQHAGGGDKGLWCTNCHNQLGQEMWKAENMKDLVHGVPGKQDDLVTDAVNIRALGTLGEIATELGISEEQAISWLDPKDSVDRPLGDHSYAIWAELPEPALCAFLVDPTNPANDGNVATIEVAIPANGHVCSTPDQLGPVDCTSVGGPIYNICGTNDADGDFSVHALTFCTTPDCVTEAQATLANSAAVPVPMSAATDGRDHWLSPGEPHCADCHAAPFVEQSGNINAYPPFNYPRKASLMRYSKGHQNISCQGCHESIHGLYPVTPNIDTTTYAQAAALNHDGSHGPLKCGTCHDVNGQGIPTFMDTSGNNVYGITDYDSAVAWAHEYTDEESVLNTTCQNCHGVNGDENADPNPNSVPADWTKAGSYNNPDSKLMEHPMDDRGSRQMLDKAEIELWGAAQTSTNGSDGVCVACHSPYDGQGAAAVSCSNPEWLDHLTEGRSSAEVFEAVSVFRTGRSCW